MSPTTQAAQVIAGSVTPVSVASSAQAPPGGCRQRSANINAMAPPTASAIASAGGAIQRAQAMPTRADKTLPPMTGQGRAIGLAGTPNTSTAVAPIGATSQGQPAAAAPPID